MTAPVDRLSNLLTHFRVRTELFYSGLLCGISRFDQNEGYGYLHVLRQGELLLSHRGKNGPTDSTANALVLPKRLEIREPTLLFYPRPISHCFHNPPAEGSSFTCARLRFDGGEQNPLVRALPPLMVLKIADVQGLAPILDLLFAETDHTRCGQRVVADRLFEVVLIYLLRWLLDHPERIGLQRGLINGMSDPAIARVLVALHREPGADWSLARMAEVAHLSRTVFATRFRDVLGQTPGDYLSDWRMSLAQSRLRHGESIKILAQDLGYANASALSRVFAARVGQSPRAWLANEQSQISAKVNTDWQSPDWS